jgi:hypothetical protein
MDYLKEIRDENVCGTVVIAVIGKEEYVTETPDEAHA